MPRPARARNEVELNCEGRSSSNNSCSSSNGARLRSRYARGRRAASRLAPDFSMSANRSATNISSDWRIAWASRREDARKSSGYSAPLCGELTSKGWAGVPAAGSLKSKTLYPASICQKLSHFPSQIYWFQCRGCGCAMYRRHLREACLKRLAFEPDCWNKRRALCGTGD